MTHRRRARACAATQAEIKDYTAAPAFMNEGKNGHHEWVIEFEELPSDLNKFGDGIMRKDKNTLCF